MSAAEALRVSGLRKSFGPVEVLRGVDLVVRRGQTLVMIGASGSGKSTCLRCMNFLEIPSAGRVHLHGELVGTPEGAGPDAPIRYSEAALCRMRARVGMVFQQFNLFPHLTALQNVMVGQVTVLRRSHAEARARAEAQLARVGLAEKADAWPAQLSGGQQQRVAIARALAMDPEVVLFDEATSALDPELVGEVLHVMRALREEGVTMVIVTHELGFAYHVAHEVAFLSEGRVHEHGPPEEMLRRPQQERTRQFLARHAEFRLP